MKTDWIIITAEGWARQTSKFKQTLSHFRLTIIAVEKKTKVKLYVCMPVLLPSFPGIKIALSLVWIHHNFPHFFINGTNFGKTLFNLKCVFRFSLQLLSETFLTLRSILRDTAINLHRSSCKILVILVRVESNLNFLVSFSENFLCQISRKSIGGGGAELFHADRRMERSGELLFLFLRTHVKQCKVAVLAYLKILLSYFFGEIR